MDLGKIATTYTDGGATEEDVKAIRERIVLVDLYGRSDAKTMPRSQRVDLCPQRVAATVAHCATRPDLPFPRQAVPIPAMSWGAPPPGQQPTRRPTKLWMSDPVKGEPRLLDLDAGEGLLWVKARRSLKRRLEFDAAAEPEHAPSLPAARWGRRLAAQELYAGLL